MFKKPLLKFLRFEYVFQSAYFNVIDVDRAFNIAEGCYAGVGYLLVACNTSLPATPSNGYSFSMVMTDLTLEGKWTKVNIERSFDMNQLVIYYSMLNGHQSNSGYVSFNASFVEELDISPGCSKQFYIRVL